MEWLNMKVTKAGGKSVVAAADGQSFYTTYKEE